MKEENKKEELCPNCGYYCTGKTVFCTPPISQAPTLPMEDAEGWEKEFDRLERTFPREGGFMARLDDKDTHEITWQPKNVKSFIRSLLQKAKEEEREKLSKSWHKESLDRGIELERSRIQGLIEGMKKIEGFPTNDAVNQALQTLSQRIAESNE